MPRSRHEKNPRVVREVYAEDLEAKLREAAGAADMVASMFDEVNPPEVAEAWKAVAREIEALRLRVWRMAR